MAGPDDIIALTDATEKLAAMQESEARAAGDYDAVDSIGKNVTNSSLYGVKKGPKVKAALTSPEKARLKNKMSIVFKQWFMEKSKYEKDDKPDTVIKRKKDEAKKSGDARLTKEDGEKDGQGLLDWISGMLGILGIGGFAGRRGLMRMLGGWIWKGVKWAGGKIWGALKGVGSAAWEAIKAGFRGVGNFFSGLWSGFKSSGFWKGFTGAISSGVQAAGNVFTAAKDKLVDALKSVGNFFKGALQKIPGIGQLFPSLAKPPKPPTPRKPSGRSSKPPKPRGGIFGLFDKGKEKLSKGFSAAKDFGGRALQKGGQMLKAGKDLAVSGATKLYEGGKSVVGKTWEGLKTVGSSAKKLVGDPLAKAWEGVKTWFKTSGKGWLGKLLKKIPFVGSAIEGAFAAYDINKYSKDPEGSMEDLEQQVGKRTLSGAMGVAMGAALAAGLSAIPGFQGWGTFLGYLAGDIVGKKIGEIMADVFGARPIGRVVLSVFPGLVENKKAAMATAAATGDRSELDRKDPAYKMNDFIWRPGSSKPVAFNRNDIVMGMKRGGPIGEMIERSQHVVNKIVSNTTQTISRLFGRTGDKVEETKQKSIFSRLLSNTNKTIKSLFGETQDTVKSLMSHSKEPKQYTTVDQILSDPFLSAEGNEGQQSARIAELQLKAIGVSNTYLSQLVQLTQALVKKPTGGGSGGNVVSVSPPSNSIPGTQGDPSGPQMGDSRVEFYNSPYSMHTPGTLT